MDTLIFTGWQFAVLWSQNCHRITGAKQHLQHEVATTEPGFKSPWESLGWCEEKIIEKQPSEKLYRDWTGSSLLFQ